MKKFALLFVLICAGFGILAQEPEPDAFGPKSCTWSCSCSYESGYLRCYCACW